MSNFDKVQAFKDLEAAHNKGDSAKAKQIADSIRADEAATSAAISGGNAVEPGIESLGDSPLESIAHGISNQFKPTEGKEFSASESAGAVAGGAAAGTTLGAIAPTLLKGAGKVLPGMFGRGATALGEALSLTPTRERMLRGGAGGAAMSGVQEAGDVMGVRPALTFAAGLVGGGLAETGASFLAKEGGNLLKFAGNATYGNVPGMSRAFSGMLDPNKPLNKQTATAAQEKLFGNKLGDYVEKLTGSDNRIAAQEALRKADPDFFAAKAAPDASGLQGKFTPTDQLKTPRSFEEVKAATQKAGVASREAAEKAAAEASLKPVSQQYREKMYEEVTNAVQQGKFFSSTPEFAKFAQNLQTQVVLGNVSRADAQNLLGTLAADRSKVTGVRGGWAKTVDNRIREWGKTLEGGQASGAAAVNQDTARAIRNDLREAFNTYTDRLGLGDIERKYRNAYGTEMIAEARDKLPSMLYGFEKGQNLTKMTKNLMQDPMGERFIQKAFAQHLAEQPPEKVLKAFENLQESLVSAKLVTPTALRELRQKAEVVQGIADSGYQLKLAERFKQILLMQLSQRAGAGAGRAVGRESEGQQQQQQP